MIEEYYLNSKLKSQTEKTPMKKMERWKSDNVRSASTTQISPFPAPNAICDCSAKNASTNTSKISIRPLNK